MSNKIRRFASTLLYAVSLSMIFLGVASPFLFPRSSEESVEYDSKAVVDAELRVPDPIIIRKKLDDDVLGISQVRLQRIKKVEVAPVASTAPPQKADASSQQPLPVFQGKLIGTIIDDDPGFSFAVIQLPNASIRLVRNSMPIDEMNPDIIVHELYADKVILLHQGTPQELELQNIRQ